MTPFKKYPVLLMIATLLATLGAFGQSGFYVPKKGKIFFKGDTATVFSDVQNDGKIGIGKNAVVRFTGTRWTNASDAEMEVDTVNGLPQGGWVVFNAAVRQYLDAGYNSATGGGPQFFNLQLQNRAGLSLVGSAAKISRELRFSAGHIYLDNQVFVVGNGYPGIISGYDSSKFFVTGRQSGGGLLVRENVMPNNGMVYFPIGTADGSYTPAGMRNKNGNGDDFSASVFDTVRPRLFSGGALVKEGVAKVWQLGKRFAPGQGEVEVQLQHLQADEGRDFAANRSRSYVSQYRTTHWDTSFLQSSLALGTITTSAIMANSAVNSRLLIGTMQQSSYFTKFAAVGPPVKTDLIFTGYRYNSSTVRLNWQTKPEINVKKFVVERRFSSENSFTQIGTVASKAPNGYSAYYLNYELDDPNSYKGITFYRLKIFDYNDSSYYSNIIGVTGVGFHEVTVWPNPTADKFTVILYGHISKYVAVHNSLGQLVWQEPVNGRSVIPMRGNQWAAGVYYISVVGNDGKISQSEKLLIIH